MAGRGLGEKPHADSYSAGQFSASFGSFTQPCTQWLHKADYKLQRIPEGAKSDAGANEPREPLIPVTEWDKLGKARTTQIQGSPGSSEPALGTGHHYPLLSAGTRRRQRHVPALGTGPGASRPGWESGASPDPPLPFAHAGTGGAPAPPPADSCPRSWEASARRLKHLAGFFPVAPSHTKSLPPPTPPRVPLPHINTVLKGLSGNPAQKRH